MISKKPHHHAPEEGAWSPSPDKLGRYKQAQPYCTSPALLGRGTARSEAKGGGGVSCFLAEVGQ